MCQGLGTLRGLPEDIAVVTAQLNLVIELQDIYSF